MSQILVSTRLRRSSCRYLAGGLVTLAVFALSVSTHSAEEKKLTVYAASKSYSLAVTDIDKVEYAGLSELLEPLGKLDQRVSVGTAKVRLNDVTGEFGDGKKFVRVGKAQMLLPAKAVIDHGRLLVPLRAMPSLLEKYLGQHSELHEAGRRLFVGTAAETFTIEIMRPENNLVLTFPAAVAPAISNEGGNIHLLFTHDPIVFGADSVTYNEKVITAVNLSEHNGTAEIVVSGPSPLVANLTDRGKTITVAAAPQVSAAPPPPAPQPATTPDTAAPNTQTTPAQKLAVANAPNPPSGYVRFFVMIDPSHGGDETGARFTDKLLEKDITLSIARKLKAELHNRGVTAALLRDSDATISYDQRAVTTNAQRAGLYIAIHAGMPGSGVRVYSAMMPSSNPQAKKRAGPFIPWDTAQAAYLEQSRRMANALVIEMSNADIVTASASAPLQPLNHISAPAVAIEVAPPESDSTPDKLTAPKYQQAIANATAVAIVNMRARIEERQ